MHLHLEMNFDKAVIVGRSYNAGFWRRSPQPPEANGGSAAEPPTQSLQFFFKKIRIFKHTLV